mmetsp:Transcript_74118/g.211601  ORF Transcript_74118/g.211601 Transcript_74118/m.211601 type:complete len:235 (-) Transcript_74118:243-947(-)
MLAMIGLTSPPVNLGSIMRVPVSELPLRTRPPISSHSFSMRNMSLSMSSTMNLSSASIFRPSAIKSGSSSGSPSSSPAFTRFCCRKLITLSSSSLSLSARSWASMASRSGSATPPASSALYSSRYASAGAPGCTIEANMVVCVGWAAKYAPMSSSSCVYIRTLLPRPERPAIDRAEWRCHEGEAVKAAAEASPRAKRPAARRAMAHSEKQPAWRQWWWRGGIGDGCRAAASVGR